MESGERDRILGRSGEPLFRWRPTSLVYPLCAGDPASPNQSANRRMTDLVVMITYNTARTHHPPAPVLLDPERRFTEGSCGVRPVGVQVPPFAFLNWCKIKKLHAFTIEETRRKTENVIGAARTSVDFWLL